MHYLSNKRPIGLNFFILTLILFFCPAPQGFGAEFQVSDSAGLTNALSTAAGNGEDDVIKIAQGNYEGQFIYDDDPGAVENFGLIIEGGYDQSFVTRAIDPENTVIDGVGTGQVLVINHDGWDAVTITIDGLSLINGANGTHGGGLYVRNPAGTTNLSNNMVMNNLASSTGGGIFLYTSKLAMDNNHIAGNHAGDSGGLHVQGGGNGVTLTNNTIRDNGSSYAVAGIRCEGGAITLSGNTISGNASTYLGAGGVDCNASASLKVYNNTITGNSVANSVGLSTDAGGIILRGPDIALTNNTITGNSCSDRGDAGGVLIRGTGSATLAIYNNIIYNNSGGSTNANCGSDISILSDGDDTVSLYNNDFDHSSDGIYQQTPVTIDGSNLNSIDPMFVDAGDNDYHLSSTSPCKDTGTNTTTELPILDKDGQSRVMNSLVDMGAFEVVDTTLMPTVSAGIDPFGRVVVDESAIQTGTISNTGSAALVLWDVSIGGGDAAQFVIVEDNCSHQTIAPGSNCTVDVQFTPTSVGTKSGILSIPTNDQNQPAAVIPLVGQGTTGEDNLQLTVEGGRYAAPGEKYSFVLYYANYLEYDAEDTVVQVSLPMDSKYIESTEGGAYRGRNHDVFWYLGTVPSGGSGRLAVTVEFRWGIPGHTMENIIAHIDADNALEHQLDNLDGYQDYEVVSLTSRIALTENVIADVLNGDSELRSIYQKSLNMGFVDYGSAEQVAYSNGSSGTIISLLKRDTFEIILVKKIDGTCFAEKFDVNSNSHMIFNADGGREYNLLSDSSTGWGAWVETPEQQTIRATGSGCDNPSKADCLVNCMADAGYEAALGPIYAAINGILTGAGCGMCVIDDAMCEKCLDSVLGILTGDDIPYVGESLAALKCIQDCLLNPKSHTCSEDLTYCWTGGYDPVLYMLYHSDLRPVITKACNLDTCKYEPAEVTYCNWCEGCVGGKCNPHIDICKDEPEIIVAGDPNAKHGEEGYVVPEQTLGYSIDYENYGEGTAFGVYILDEIDDNLDETTIAINNGGVYFPASRMVMWYVGDVAAGAGGSVSFDVDVAEGLAGGTEIINSATVYFPSVPEVTPTNAVVNKVFQIAAHGQSLEATAGQTLDITLTGSDVDDVLLTYRIVGEPLHGTLTGSAPNLTYNAGDDYSGPDKFTFTVSNGVAESEAAEIRIAVQAAADTSDPEVLRTYPLDQQTGVAVSDTQIVNDAYLPVISAVFSESLDPDTVHGTSFLVSGLTGTVTYDDAEHKAFFIPQSPLTHGTTYTATLTAAVKDLNDNTLGSDFTWQFTTNAAIDIQVVLAIPEATEMNFAALEVGATSTYQMVTVTSTGSETLHISELSLAGDDANCFKLENNLCNAAALVPGDSCTTRVLFNPQSAGNKLCELRISSDADDSSTVIVSLSGTATETIPHSDDGDDSGSGGGGGGGCFISSTFRK